MFSWKLCEMEIPHQEPSSALLVSGCKYLVLYRHISRLLLATYVRVWLVQAARAVRLHMKNG